MGNADCAQKDSSEPICGTDGQCHECGRNAHCLDANRPVCEQDTGVCVACVAHEECASGACELDSGRCIADADTIYGDSINGVDGPFCGNSPAAACKHLEGEQGAFDKVTASRRHIVLAPGSYIESFRLSSIEVDIIGNGARLFPPAFEIGPAFEITSGSNVGFHDLIIEGGNGIAGGVGVACLNSGIEFHAVTIRNNDDEGVDALDCDLEFYDSKLLENGRSGVNLSGGELQLEDTDFLGNDFQGLRAFDSSLEIDRCEFVNNAAGGLHLSATDFVIENSVIAKNGNKTMNPGIFSGGVVVSNGAGVSPQIIRHCTVADNEGPTILGAAGIDCGLGGNDVLLHSSIVVGNEKPTGSSQVGGNCDVRFSNVTGIASGEGNISVAPTFVSPATDDYHLAAGSAGIDLADPSSPTTVDIDGQSRPVGAGFDMGADERQQ
jgi:hypothetical protein